MLLCSMKRPEPAKETLNHGNDKISAVSRLSKHPEWMRIREFQEYLTPKNKQEKLTILV